MANRQFRENRYYETDRDRIHPDLYLGPEDREAYADGPRGARQDRQGDMHDGRGSEHDGPYDGGDMDGVRGRDHGHRSGQSGRERQSHRGRGPRNYRRSDERIRDDVCDRLWDDHDVDASDIEVSVSDRDVTLSGEVDSKHAKRCAEDCAESVSGVEHVQNDLRVRTSGSGAESDRDGRRQTH